MSEGSEPGREGVRVGLLSNPKSGSNRRRPGALERVLQDYPETVHRDASNPGEIRENERVMTQAYELGQKLAAAD